MKTRMGQLRNKDTSLFNPDECHYKTRAELRERRKERGLPYKSFGLSGMYSSRDPEQEKDQ